MPAIVVPEGYTFVLATTASILWLNAWQAFRVGQFRKRAGVKYPQLYAEVAEAASSADKTKFNCAQRAHQNTLESVPSLMFGILLTGLQYPLLAAGLGSTWVAGKVLYTIGYSTGDPSKRNKRGGVLGSGAAMGLLFSTTYVAYKLVQSEL